MKANSCGDHSLQSTSVDGMKEKEIKEAIVNGIIVNSLAPIRDAVSHLTRLDDFNVVKLSAGFFSEVFKVTHISTRKVMVLKMNKHAANRSNALKEIELLNKLNHPNVVAFMGTVVHEGQLHPLLEYLNSGTLENLIKKFYAASVVKHLSTIDSSPSSRKCCEHFSTTEDAHHKLSPLFCKLAKDVAQGMCYLHHLNYMHRDLTSKNVLIRRQPDALTTSNDPRDLTAVIADFGFATNEPLATDPKLAIVGSPYWLAPECLKDLWYNHKCDIFSFGVICCELNWKIPADPDFLPRNNDFLILFNKLPLSTSVLSKISKLATNGNPALRPEFSEIISIFEDSGDTPFIHNEKVQTTTEACAFEGEGDVFDQHLTRRRNSMLSEVRRQENDATRRSLSPRSLIASSFNGDC